MTRPEAAIETARLVLRDYVATDAEAALALYADDEVMRFLGGVKHRDVGEMREFLVRISGKYAAFRAARLPYGAWAVLEKESDTLVGTALFKPLPDGAGVDTPDLEIGWHLTRAAWGQGYATEFGRALIRHAFDALPPIDAVHAVIDPLNARSQAVARRLGMAHHGRVSTYYGVENELFVLTRAQRDAQSGA